MLSNRKKCFNLCCSSNTSLSTSIELKEYMNVRRQTFKAKILQGSQILRSNYSLWDGIRSQTSNRQKIDGFQDGECPSRSKMHNIILFKDLNSFAFYSQFFIWGALILYWSYLLRSFEVKIQKFNDKAISMICIRIRTRPFCHIKYIFLFMQFCIYVVYITYLWGSPLFLSVLMYHYIYLTKSVYMKSLTNKYYAINQHQTMTTRKTKLPPKRNT